MNVKSGRADCWGTPVILSSTKKMNTLAFGAVTYQRDSCPGYQQEHPDAKRHSGIFHLNLVHPIRNWGKMLLDLYKVYVFTCN